MTSIYLLQACRTIKSGVCAETLPVSACLETRYTDQCLPAHCIVALAYNFVADFADFFHAAIHTPLYAVLLVMAVIYTSTFFFFGLLWWSILRQVI